MIARLGPSVLASLLLVPLGCKRAKGVDVDPAALIPAQANAALGFRLDPLRASPVGGMLSGALRSEPDVAAVMTAVSTCEVELAGMTGLTAGDMTDDENGMMVAISAPGLGNEDVVRCLEKEAGRATGEGGGLVLFETRGDVRITPQQDGGHLIILNKDTLVVVDQAWESQVFAAIEDPASRSTDSSLAKAMGRVDRSSDLWLSAMVPEDTRADLAEIPGADGIETINATLALGEGIALALDMGLVDASKAETLRTALSEALGELTPEDAAQMGIPDGLLDSIELAGEGSQVTAKVALGGDAVGQMVGMMGALMAEP